MGASKAFGNAKLDEISVVLGAPAPPQPGQDESLVTISGWGDGTFLTVRQITDLTARKQGAGGEIGVVLSNSSEFEIDMQIIQTSSDNAKLSTLVQIYKSTGVAIPFYMEDASGNTKMVGGTAIPVKYPDVTYTKDSVDNYTWTWYVGHLEMFVGGNVA